MIEDYLKTIYGHTEWQDAPITGSQLAARLGLVPSSVTEMVKKLVALGLVRHAPYGAITLTDAGRAEALRMVRRHRLVETWLVEGFGYRWDEVHDEAEVLEHALSDRLLDAIDAQLGHPVRDPHGDPIPDGEGRVARPDAVLASRLEPGVAGRVARINDRDPEVLRRIEAAGIGLDTVVTVGELPDGAAESVWVVVLR
ncbi:metal-dependent transcriptional regulator [Protaetiibacter intestinalis]|uniref:metal-dependent transcriptional regulator n=1 Tax=Protaetiibacter intestinalis TaxID=2419774 RepID=UPI00221F29B9|nr:metal-dependent transcriptional regulator [Protaetiibacter intestinalis]